MKKITKKLKALFSYTWLIFLLEVLALIIVTTPRFWSSNAYYSNRVTFGLGILWICGIIFLCFAKGKLEKVLSRLLRISNIIAVSGILAAALIFLLTLFHPYQGSFSTTTSLFDDKNVMIIIPHQDDDINLVGGLIEQYTDSGSDVTVVFTTNGDRFADCNVRAAEVVQVLTTLGVNRENIYYLGFGDNWMSQTIDGTETEHIYNSMDPDAVWTSCYGATATYSSESIPCYLDLPYTRNNYLYSLQHLIEEKMPDTIFATDYDGHTDHRAASLFFEEALCNILTRYPDYHPKVYKGFAYGTAWTAIGDYFDSINLLSTVHPDERTWSHAAYGYDWSERMRFPISETNLNWVMMNNSVYRSLSQYRSQFAFSYTTSVLNSDKVFWERRTDSLLYGAEVFADGKQTTLLTDFKIKDFYAIAPFESPSSGFVALQSEKATIRTEEDITVNCIRLYDNPDPAANILSGYIDFSDGSRIDFSQLKPDGGATILSFPEKKISWMEVIVTETEGDTAGLSEIEAFYDLPAPQTNNDHFLMAVDKDDNFVYDYLLRGGDSVELTIGRFPGTTPLTEADLSLSFEASGKDASCHWEDDVLVVTCGQGARCIVTVSDGVTSTTFAVSNPTNLEYAYLQTLRYADRTFLNLRSLAYIYHQVFYSVFML